jgi:DNA adenine methylase
LQGLGGYAARQTVRQRPLDAHQTQSDETVQLLNERADRAILPSPVQARPFVKWVGGKRQLLPHLLPIFAGANRFGTYHEPFIGGGAVFFALRNQGRARESHLSDVNKELIASYAAIRDMVDNVILSLKRHARRSTEAYFYEVRAARPRTLPEIAARLIYLNRTCYNGLYRVNNSGGFNAPWGRYDNPTICDESNLRTASALLSTAELSNASFESVLDAARHGDVVYFDPPYVPVSVTSSFTEYSARGFGRHDQEALAAAFRELDKRGVCVVLSNSDTPDVRRLYAGFAIEQVFARRSVNTRGDRRGPVAEVIVRNC